MFFVPLWFYIKQLLTTVIVEAGLFTLLVSKKPLDILASICFNILTHLSLTLFFSYMLLTSIGYNFYVYLIGEVMVTLVEACLYSISKCIPNFKRALLFSLLFNAASILAGLGINLILGI